MKEDFIRILYENRLLTSITIELTNVCNLRCSQCYQEDRLEGTGINSTYLDFDVIRKIIDDVSGTSVMCINLTGGEALTHRYVFETIDLITSRNIRLNLLTNATMINDENIAILKKVNVISTTRYGNSKHIYEKVTGVEGSFDRYCRAIELIRNNHIRLIEKSLIMHDNYCEMTDLVGHTKYSDDRILVNKSNGYSSKCSLSCEQHNEYLSVKEAMGKEDDNQNASGPRRCKLWYSSLFIDCKGNVTPCLNLSDPAYVFGNIYADNLWDIWNSYEAKRTIEKLEERLNDSRCYSCEYGKQATVCPANNLYETGEVHIPSEYECNFCKLKAEHLKSRR